MAESSTIARPYARAVFDLARESAALDDWSRMLGLLAGLVRHPDLAVLLGSPRIGKHELAELIVSIAGDTLTEAGRNFVRLLAENRRLIHLPIIAERYETLRAEHAGVVYASLTTAQPVPDEQLAAVREALRQRLQREVELTVATDPELLGGAVIRAGDLVIDGSVRGRLKQLAQALNS